MLTSEQKAAVEQASEYFEQGTSKFDRKLSRSLRSILSASDAPAEGRELTEMIDNNIESLGNVAMAADEKALPGLAKLLRKASDTLSRCRTALATAPTTSEAHEAIELLRKFMEYRDSEYVPNALFDRARCIIDRAAAKGGKR